MTLQLVEARGADDAKGRTPRQGPLTAPIGRERLPSATGVPTRVLAKDHLPARRDGQARCRHESDRGGPWAIAPPTPEERKPAPPSGRGLRRPRPPWRR